MKKGANTLKRGERGRMGEGGGDTVGKISISWQKNQNFNFEFLSFSYPILSKKDFFS